MALASALALVLCVLSACVDSADPSSIPLAPRSYGFAVRVHRGPGQPLAGAKLLRDGRVLAVSDEDGQMKFELAGYESARARLDLQCPEGHRPSEPALEVVLRSYRNGARPQMRATCSSEASSLALVVRAPLARGLPITHRGRKLTHLDEHGVTHVLLRGRPGDVFDVTLETGTRPQLRPSNPGARFVLGDTEQVALFDPHLERKRIKRKEPPPEKNPEPDLPQRIR